MPEIACSLVEPLMRQILSDAARALSTYVSFLRIYLAGGDRVTK